MAMSQARYESDSRDYRAAVEEARRLADERGVSMVVVQGSRGLKNDADSWHGNYAVIARTGIDIWHAKVKCDISPAPAVAAQ